MVRGSSSVGDVRRPGRPPGIRAAVIACVHDGRAGVPARGDQHDVRGRGDQHDVRGRGGRRIRRGSSADVNCSVGGSFSTDGAHVANQMSDRTTIHASMGMFVHF